MELATVWESAAVVAPPLPDPLLAPPAASTVVTTPEVVLLPIWPVAEALPVVLVARPVLDTVVELVPVPLAMLVLAVSMPSP